MDYYTIGVILQDAFKSNLGWTYYLIHYKSNVYHTA